MRLQEPEGEARMKEITRKWEVLPVAEGGLSSVICLFKGHVWLEAPYLQEPWGYIGQGRTCQRCGRTEIA